ncbi:hypothetical protein HK104_002729, partial [Borealophlyctis nickersoniae]
MGEQPPQELHPPAQTTQQQPPQPPAATDSSWRPLPRGTSGIVICAFHPTYLPTSTILESAPSAASSVASLSTLESAAAAEYQVPLELGDNVHLLEESAHWYRGYVFTTGGHEQPKIGIFPVKHIYSRSLECVRLKAAGGANGTAAAGGVNGSAAAGGGGGAAGEPGDPAGGTLSAIPPSVKASIVNGTTTTTATAAALNGIAGDKSLLARPGLQRTQTLPMTQPSSMVSVDSTSPQPSPALNRKKSRQLRPLSYGSNYTFSNRPFHPIPTPVAPTHETAAGLKEPLVDEIAATLREWGIRLKDYLTTQRYDHFTKVNKLFQTLYQGRRTLLSQTLSQDGLTKLRRKLIATMEEGNRLQGLDLIVRHPDRGSLLNERNTSIINMFRMHIEQAHRHRSKDASSPTNRQSAGAGSTGAVVEAINPGLGGLGSMPTSSAPKGDLDELSTRFSHLYFELKACIASFCLPNEYAELYFSIYNRAEGRAVTEEYQILVNSAGMPRDVGDGGAAGGKGVAGRLKTLFVDLSHRDLTDHMYLVCRIVRTGKMNVSEKEAGSATKGAVHHGGMMQRESSSSSLSGLMGGVNGVGGGGGYRRPFGWATVPIGEILREKNASDSSLFREIVMPIFVPVSESGFGSLHEQIINRVGGYESSARAEALNVTLRLFHGDAGPIIRENAMLLKDVTVTPRNGFSDVILPGDVRNAMYVTLTSGEFSQGRKTSARNVEVTVQVRLTNGEFLTQCISRGAGEPRAGSYDSLVYYHNNTPRWNETVRLDLSPDLFEKAHIFFTFRHCSSSDKGSGDKTDRNFAFAFLPLLRGNHTVINDGSHGLILYKWDRKFAVPGVYLTYPAGPNIFVPTHLTDSVMVAADVMSKLPALKDTLTVRTNLCSTKLTQNVSLLNLVHWRQAVASHRLTVDAILKDFCLIGELEIIKFLPSIFDALFHILDSKDANRDGKLDDAVFKALVFILGIVMDKRFTNHRPTVDAYIEGRFGSTGAWKGLVGSFEGLVGAARDANRAKELRSAVRVWQYIFRFAIQSNLMADASREAREARSRRDATSTATTAPTTTPSAVPDRLANAAPTPDFLTAMTSLFSSVNVMMSLTSPEHVIGSQTLTLQYFPAVLPELARVFQPTHLVSLVARFTDSVRGSKSKLNAHRLNFIHALLRGFLFANPRSRVSLVPNVARWLGECLGGEWDKAGGSGFLDDVGFRGLGVRKERENLRLCLNVCAELVDRVTKIVEKGKSKKDAEGDGEREAAVMHVAELLPKLLELYCEVFETNAGKGGQGGQRDRPVSHESAPSVTPSQAEVEFEQMLSIVNFGSQSTTNLASTSVTALSSTLESPV